MLYGERYIDNEKLKKWVNQWEIGRAIDAVSKKINVSQAAQEFKNLMLLQIEFAKELGDKIQDESYYDCLLTCISPAIMDAYFKFDNSSIKLANFYELLLFPADMETKKKLIKGYESGGYQEIGKVIIQNEGRNVGNIGEKSDLIWSVFYNDFIVNIEEGEAVISTHTHNHEEYLTLQLFNADEYTDEALENYVQEILYNCSIKLSLNFRKASVHPLYKEIGNAGEYTLDFERKKFEDIPLLYFNSTFDDISARIKFLSYYQVIEYYYVRANNNLMANKLVDAGIADHNTFDPKVLTKLCKEYRKGSVEDEAIKLVLERAIDINEFKAWLNADPIRREKYTNNTDPDLTKLNINLSRDERIIASLCKRIYSLRCSIVHSKADIDEMLFIPDLNDGKLVDETPLMSYVASKVLEAWGIK
ncbi:MAG: hypothetical protein P4L69_19650 [Desulfosporosinus sp.]|nr:hypothetical protein [Desulfosporosinus sp.]